MAATTLGLSLLALLACVTVTDLRSRLVPDCALIAAALLALAVIGVSDPPSLPGRLGCGAAAGGFLLAAALARPGGMGLGDVKLAGVLGLYLGQGVVLALLIAFLGGALAGLVLVARHGWSARSHTIPFAPFMAFGAVAGMALAA